MTQTEQAAALSVELDAMCDKGSLSDTDKDILKTVSALLVSQAEKIETALGVEAKPAEKCQGCGGMGSIDSGGVTPWGDAIGLPCPDCTTAGGEG